MKRSIYNDAIILVFLLSLMVIAAFSGCVGGTETGNPESSTFKSDAALAAYLADQYAQSAQPTSLWALDNEAQPGWTNGEMYAGEKGYSETNIQEIGVDESDTVKTDGTYLYVAGADEVRVISAIPPQSMQVENRIAVSGMVDSLYLYEKVLVILYTPSGGEGVQWVQNDLKMVDIGMPYWNPVQAKLGIMIVDVSTPANPSIIKDIQADGTVLSSRLTNGNLYIISQFIPDLPPLEVWYDGTETGRQSSIEANTQTLQPLALDDYMPFYSLYDGIGALVQEGRLIATEDFVRPENPSGGTIVSVVTVPLSDLSKDFSSMGFVADIHHVYASTNAIYLISTTYQGDPQTDTLTDPDIYQTRIYQLDISGDTVIYSAEGMVNGHILNSFSLGEYNDVLRIATTTGYVWDGSASNHLFCLKKQGAKLDVIGRLENLAPGERLYSARFIGEKGFLVTFVEVDPLFTIDLSDPENPAAVGELKVPGYSTYLHPLGDDYLFAFGKDTASDNGTVLYQGLKLSVFDITDFAAPKLLAGKTIGDRGTDSEALFNHKALTFMLDQNLLALPVSLYEFLSPPENPWEYGENTFTGLYIYRLTDAYEFEYLGRMDMSVENGDGLYYPGWLRGVFIDDFVYSVNADTVKAAEVNLISEPFFYLNLVP